MPKIDYAYEHMVIDNNSSDQTIPIFRKLADKDKKLRFN